MFACTCKVKLKTCGTSDYLGRVRRVLTKMQMLEDIYRIHGAKFVVIFKPVF